MNNQTFGLISIAVGILVAIYFFWTLKRQLVTTKWIATSGKVLESKIIENQSSYEPYVKYSYVVRGATYICDYITPNKYTVEQATQSTLDKMIAPYPVGKTVKVYFNPENPHEAVLKKYDSILGSIIFAIVSGMFIFGGIVLMIQK